MDFSERPREDAQRLAEETIELNRTIIEETEESVADRDVGLDNFGEQGARQRLAFIFENIPFDEPVETQIAYLLRAVMCAQIFNDGNKRTAIVLSVALARRNGFRVSAEQDPLYEFVLRRFGECPRWPMQEKDVLARDKMFLDIATWFRNRVERV